jgi:hypothetical protein
VTCTIGLINDLRAAHTTFPAAALSPARVLSFVYLFTPINDYIINFVILLIGELRVEISDAYRSCLLSVDCNTHDYHIE